MVSVSNDLDPFSKGARDNQRDLCEIYWKEGKNVCEDCQAADMMGGRNVFRYYMFFLLLNLFLFSQAKTLLLILSWDIFPANF